MGNAGDLSSRSAMWRDVIKQLEMGNQIGPALPIACNRHPDTINYISQPGEIPKVSPDGKNSFHCSCRLL
jgi:hypothetical protein